MDDSEEGCCRLGRGMWTTRNRARSAVGRAHGLVSQGSGFDPDLFHKACYMPFTCRWRFEIKLGIGRLGGGVLPTRRRGVDDSDEGCG